MLRWLVGVVEKDPWTERRSVEPQSVDKLLAPLVKPHRFSFCSGLLAVDTLCHAVLFAHSLLDAFSIIVALPFVVVFLFSPTVCSP